MLWKTVFVAVLLTACPLLTFARDAPKADKGKEKGEDERKVKTLYIAHVNDVHNRIEPTDASLAPFNVTRNNISYGGYARIATQVTALRAAAKAENAAFLFLNAGDEFLGTLWDVLYRGYATALLQRLPQLRYARTPNTHARRPCAQVVVVGLDIVLAQHSYKVCLVVAFNTLLLSAKLQLLWLHQSNRWCNRN